MKKINRAYTVAYRIRGYKTEKIIAVLASSKEEAYDRAVYEAIPEKEGEMPYSAWVTGATYQNGNYRSFNTCEGLPY